MRTGKTRTVVRTADRLHRFGDLLGVLVLAPNGVHSNWVRREIPQWADPGGVAFTYSSSASRARTAEYLARRSALLDKRGLGDHIRWLAVNDEALINPRAQQLIQEFRTLCHDRILLVADESTMFRRPGADRTRIVRGLAQKMWWRRILEGTALLNSPLHAFSQYEILQKGALGFTSYEDFKGRYSVWRSQRERYTNRSFTVLDHYQNLEELRERMAQYSSVVLRSDCNDMPELLEVPVEIEMSDKQKKAYVQMAKEMMVDVKDDEIIAALNGGSKFIKLHQIVSGFLMNASGEVVSIDDNPPLLQALEREVLGSGGKNIVWCRFQEDIRRVVARIRKTGRSPVEYHGKVSPRDREIAIDRFQNDPSATDFVGQPQAGARGLNLSAADAIIWYSSIPDAIITGQGNERGTQMGGKSVSIVTLATPNTVHDSIVESNQGKMVLADKISGRGLKELLTRQLAALRV